MQWLLLAGLVVLIVWQARLVLNRVREVQAPAKALERRRQLERVEPGGVPSNPIPIDSPAVVEPKTVALVCLKCGSLHRMLEHSVFTFEGERLRKAEAQCVGCGNQRVLYFKLRPGPN